MELGFGSCGGMEDWERRVERRCGVMVVEAGMWVDGGREERERVDVVEGAALVRREMAGEGGAGRVEVSGDVEADVEPPGIEEVSRDGMVMVVVEGGMKFGSEFEFRFIGGRGVLGLGGVGVGASELEDALAVLEVTGGLIGAVGVRGSSSPSTSSRGAENIDLLFGVGVTGGSVTFLSFSSAPPEVGPRFDPALNAACARAPSPLLPRFPFAEAGGGFIANS